MVLPSFLARKKRRDSLSLALVWRGGKGGRGKLVSALQCGCMVGGAYPTTTTATNKQTTTNKQINCYLHWLSKAFSPFHSIDLVKGCWTKVIHYTTIIPKVPLCTAFCKVTANNIYKMNFFLKIGSPFLCPFMFDLNRPVWRQSGSLAKRLPL